MSVRTSLHPESITEPLARLRDANLALARTYPGEAGKRQPVHTVYGGAHLFASESASKLGALARRALDEHGPDFVTFARAIGLRGSELLPSGVSEITALAAAFAADAAVAGRAYPAAALAHTLYTRVRAKLEREAVEDFRIDFEDGYGNRPDAEEDGHAGSAAREVAKGLAAGALPPFIGIRIKPFTEELRARSVRTLDAFLTTLVEATGKKLPEGFVITLPKVSIPEQPAALVAIFEALEQSLGLPAESLKFELMIETTQSILNARGESQLLHLLEAGKGRCVSAHFGTYDYTASCNITAAYQHMGHPACDFARHMMQVAYASTGITLSDGATNVMPIGIHRAGKDGPALTPAQLIENRATVHRAWKLHYDNCRHSLMLGYYQGWDLHPAQLPTRYAAAYSFFLEGLGAASDRLRNFLGKAAQATLAGDVFDDAATGQGLLNFFLRGVSCGAITEEEALTTGVTLAELRGRSFLKILENRRG
jgi:citrate lyase beta subunit